MAVSCELSDLETRIDEFISRCGALRVDSIRLEQDLAFVVQWARYFGALNSALENVCRHIKFDSGLILPEFCGASVDAFSESLKRVVGDLPPANLEQPLSRETISNETCEQREQRSKLRVRRSSKGSLAASYNSQDYDELTPPPAPSASGGSGIGQVDDKSSGNRKRGRPVQPKLNPPSSSKPIDASSAEFRLNLVSLVKQYPFLYAVGVDVKRTVRASAWKAISKQMGCRPEICINAWRAIRDYNARYVKKRSLPGFQSVAKWYLFDHLAFLREADDNESDGKQDRFASFEFRLKMVRLVKAHPCLYAQGCEVKRGLRVAAWAAISEQLDCEADTCIQIWRCLRDYYARYLKKRRSRAPGSKRPAKWNLADHMKFLRSVLSDSSGKSPNKNASTPKNQKPSSSAAAAATKEGRDFQKKLVRLVRDRPCLHDTAGEDTLALSEAAWQTIAEQLACSVDRCREVWRQLRDAFFEFLKKRRNAAPGCRRAAKWYFASRLSFLRNHEPLERGPGAFQRDDLLARQPEEDEKLPDNSLNVISDGDNAVENKRSNFKTDKHVKKPSFEFKVQLIGLVRQHPVLYTFGSEGKKTERRVAWKTISKQLHCHAKSCARVWRHLRDYYARYLKRCRQRVPGYAGAAKWNLADKMKFLRTVWKDRPVTAKSESASVPKKPKKDRKPSKAAIIAKENRDFYKKLVHLVKDHSCLHGPIGDSVKTRRVDAWRTIAEQMDCDVDRCRSAWKYVRGYFFDYLKKRRNVSPGSKRLAKWYLASRLSFLRNHEPPEKERANPPFHCHTCDIAFSSYNALYVHGREHKKEWSKDPFEAQGVMCATCCYRTTSRKNLSLHMFVMHRPKSAKVLDPSEGFPCHICSQVLKTKATLAQHLTNHSGEKNFVCEQCGFKTHNIWNLFSHKRSHRSRIIACSVEGCTAAFRRRQTMLAHVRSVHEERRNFAVACDQCPLRFPCQYSLKKHYVVHTGEKPYPCALCGRPFTRLTNVKTHLRMVHKLKMPPGLPIDYSTAEALAPFVAAAAKEAEAKASQLRAANSGHGLPAEKSKVIRKSKNNEAKMENALQSRQPAGSTHESPAHLSVLQPHPEGQPNFLTNQMPSTSANQRAGLASNQLPPGVLANQIGPTGVYADNAFSIDFLSYYAPVGDFHVNDYQYQPQMMQPNRH